MSVILRKHSKKLIGVHRVNTGQKEKNNIICAVVQSDDIVITDAQSALDLLMSAKYDVGTKNVAINKELIVEDFFILSRGLVCKLWWSCCYLR